jgi:outer membrane protein
MRCLIPVMLGLCLATPAGAVDLLEAFRSARDHDATFAADRAAAGAGAEYRAQARAALLPQASISAQYGRRTSRTQLGLAGELASELDAEDGGTVHGYGLQITQPVYRPDAVADSHRLAAQAEIASLTFEAAQQDLVLRVAQAYVDVLAADDELAYARAQQRAVAEQLASARARFDAGRARATDVAEAQAQYDSLVAVEIAARNELRVRLERLRSLTGLGIDSVESLPQSAYDFALEDDATWLQRAQENNPDLRLRDLETRIATADERETRLAGRPTIDLVVAFEEQQRNGGAPSLVDPDRSTVKSTGLQFRMPLFAGGALASRHRAAVLRLREAEQRREATRREVALIVADTLADVRDGMLRVAALEQALSSARLSLQAGELGATVGNRTNLDVLTLRQQVFDAERALSGARHGVVLSHLQLQALVGGLNEAALSRTAGVGTSS